MAVLLYSIYSICVMSEWPHSGVLNVDQDCNLTSLIMLNVHTGPYLTKIHLQLNQDLR